MKRVTNILALIIMLTLFTPFVYTKNAFAQSLGEVRYEEEYDLNMDEFDSMFEDFQSDTMDEIND